MISESFYCLTTSDGNFDAYSIFQKRIAEKKWPLYYQTKYQNVVKPNDGLIFYIAGINKFRQCFVASAKIKERVHNNWIYSNQERIVKLN